MSVQPLLSIVSDSYAVPTITFAHSLPDRASEAALTRLLEALAPQMNLDWVTQGETSDSPCHHLHTSFGISWIPGSQHDQAGEQQGGDEQTRGTLLARLDAANSARLSNLRRIGDALDLSGLTLVWCSDQQDEAPLATQSWLDAPAVRSTLGNATWINAQDMMDALAEGRLPAEMLLFVGDRAGYVMDAVVEGLTRGAGHGALTLQQGDLAEDLVIGPDRCVGTMHGAAENAEAVISPLILMLLNEGAQYAAARLWDAHLALKERGVRVGINQPLLPYKTFLPLADYLTLLAQSLGDQPRRQAARFMPAQTPGRPRPKLALV